MLYIITGGINQGKTTWLLSLYREIKRGDGFVVKKVYIEGVNAGQEIMRLSTGERKCFSWKEGFIPKDWDEECRYGPYSFSKRGFAFAEKIVLDLIQTGNEPVFIDEIGPLELEGRGFQRILLMILKEKTEAYVAIRENCIENAVKKFGIKDYTLIRL